MNRFPVTPPGIRVPPGGSCCGNCRYVDPSGVACMNPNYVGLSYNGKRVGDARFIDGKTGRVVANPFEFCCNVYDTR